MSEPVIVTQDQILRFARVQKNSRELNMGSGGYFKGKELARCCLMTHYGVSHGFEFDCSDCGGQDPAKWTKDGKVVAVSDGWGDIEDKGVFGLLVGGVDKCPNGQVTYGTFKKALRKGL